MRQNQKGFAHHFLLPLFVLVAIFFIGFTVLKAHQPKHTTANSKQPAVQAADDNPGSMWASPAVYAQLPDCKGNQLLTNMPIANSVAYQMIPLGNVNATGGHTYPTDHMYVDFDNKGTYDVISPGTVYVTKVRRFNMTVNNSDVANDSVYMMPCKQLVVYFNHVYPSSKIEQEIPNTNDPKTNDCAASKTQNAHNNSTTSVVNSDCSQLATKLVKFNPGEVIATAKAGSNQAGFDFGTLDARVPDLKLINPATEGDTHTSNGLSYLKSVCPISYMPAGVQQTVFSGSFFAARPANDKCGDIAQDKLGTIQGNWYEGEHPSYTASWQKELAVLHFNYDPSVVEISVGGTLGTGGMFAFTPSTNGTTNPEPSMTKAGPLYCFVSNIPEQSVELENDPYSVGHQLLMQLMDGKTMKVEYQTGSCSGHDSFNQPFMYYR